MVRECENNGKGTRILTLVHRSGSIMFFFHFTMLLALSGCSIQMAIVAMLGNLPIHVTPWWWWWKVGGGGGVGAYPGRCGHLGPVVRSRIKLTQD